MRMNFIWGRGYVFEILYFHVKRMPNTYSVISTSQANSAKEPVESSIAYKIKRQVTYTHINRRKWLVLYREKGGKGDK